MGHSEELINNIVNKLSKQYPPNLFKYVIEKSLTKTKKRMIPDIQVFKGNELNCIVEIGYTRPE